MPYTRTNSENDPAPWWFTIIFWAVVFGGGFFGARWVYQVVTSDANFDAKPIPICETATPGWVSIATDRKTCASLRSADIGATEEVRGYCSILYRDVSLKTLEKCDALLEKIKRAETS